MEVLERYCRFSREDISLPPMPEQINISPDRAVSTTTTTTTTTATTTLPTTTPRPIVTTLSRFFLRPFLPGTRNPLRIK
ncbi:hypothetical protein ScPMuIL_012695 [Solemya velum]